MRIVDLINAVADAPDPESRIRVLIGLLPDLLDNCFDADDPDGPARLAELNEKREFIVSAIVSGGHVHEMSMRFEGKAAAG